MKWHMSGVTLGCGLAGLSLFAGVGSAQSGSHQWLVTPAWVAQHQQDASLVLLHIGDSAEYDSGHISGAQLISLTDISQPDPVLHLQMAPVAKLRETFERLGVSNDSHVVLYFGKDWVTPTARVFVALDYLGLGDHTSLLDGGLAAWRDEGHAVTADVPTVHRGTLTPHPHEAAIVDAKWVSAHLKTAGIAVVDARAPEFYTGDSDGRGHIPRPGHILGAVSVPFTTLNEESLKLKDVAALRQIFEQAGIKPGDEVVTYCHIGQQASHAYFVARYLGYTARLYDGSYEEWAANAELPIERKGTR
jgi:thiosulfate/3-mercaptopyruvate sulfurtransferase